MPVIINLPKKTGIDEAVIDNKIQALEEKHFQFRDYWKSELTLDLESNSGAAYLLICQYKEIYCVYLLFKEMDSRIYNKILLTNNSSLYTLETTQSTVKIKGSGAIIYSLTRLS